jgi:hypothetical protein
MLAGDLGKSQLGQELARPVEVVHLQGGPAVQCRILDLGSGFQGTCGLGGEPIHTGLCHYAI